MYCFADASIVHYPGSYCLINLYAITVAPHPLPRMLLYSQTHLRTLDLPVLALPTTVTVMTKYTQFPLSKITIQSCRFSQFVQGVHGILLHGIQMDMIYQKGSNRKWCQIATTTTGPSSPLRTCTFQKMPPIYCIR